MPRHGDVHSRIRHQMVSLGLCTKSREILGLGQSSLLASIADDFRK